MFSRRLVAPWGLLFLIGVLVSCGGKEPNAATRKSAEDFFEIRIGAKIVKMQIAALPDETQRGLMFRKSLNQDAGMLFVFDRDQQMSFWMRNTLIPLDIGYIDSEGTLREIYPMYPLDERPVPSRSRDLRFALEVNQGWFKTNGIGPGDKLDTTAVREALRARGLRAEVFGLQ